MRVFIRYLLDQKIALLTYMGFILIFGVTFFLHDISFEAYSDALLFSFFLLAVIAAVQFYRYYSKHQQLDGRKKAVKLHVLDRKRGSTLLEEDYEEMLHSLDKEYRQEIGESKRVNHKLMDYYSLWSHQIKTPLAVLNLKMQENQLDHTVLKQELFKIDQYLDMMLQYLRLNHTETDFVFETIDIDRLIKETVKKYATFFIYQNLSFSFQETKQSVISDKKWLQFVVEQILINAIKYTKRGGIRIYANPENSKELIIADSGIGILPEDRQRIFEKGYTGYNGHNHQKASGLGLYMSDEVMRSLGHTIHITSEVGKGTKVWLDLSQHLYQIE
ncbi:sensor histidine kinase [Enterococcus sp. BWB1-3]|uniref:sensor histidine kinase n=1 Tax=unclassified Enterococcus TaxID=2608891 RepID=UPI0019243154|nr:MULTISPECIES: sensor histidine kinase [unclassified Enterococcus]MBL1228327.1 sensor histidine kinase [Enterococcus sp. BWB1-3]MCB5951147.1 sensor histidine kinase [Enterococcus sp. BWT-B8]